MIGEAMSSGYMVRSVAQRRKADGKWDRYDYVVGMPDSLEQYIENSTVAFLPHARNPHTGDVQRSKETKRTSKNNRESRNTLPKAPPTRKRKRSSHSME